MPYAKHRPGLRGLSCGELTEIVLNSKAYRVEIGTICDQLDATRAKRRGPKPSYTAWECEAVLVYQRVCGLRAVKEARDRLAGDRAADARRIFGFNKARPRKGGAVQKLHVGIPSEATLSRHRSRFGERRRRRAYERLFEALVQEHLEDFPEMREEARHLTMDGSKIQTHYKCPINDPKGGMVNEKEVTCWDGGYVPPSAGPDKWGHGYEVIGPVTHSGLPLAARVVPINASEPETAISLMQGEFAHRVRPHLDQDQIHVMSNDGAYHSHPLRKTYHELGIVERVHHVSRGDSPKSHANARKHDRLRFEIQGYKNWEANGHYELICKCGNGQVSKRFALKSGRAVIRSEGSCSTCGLISITAGNWRKAKLPGSKKAGRFVRCMPGEKDEADQAFGNPLTYNDPLAFIYGNKRFAHNEGFHGQVTSRFQLFKGKRWFRRKDQARTDVAIVYSIVHCLAMEQRRRAAAHAVSSSSDPPTALAA